MLWNATVAHPEAGETLTTAPLPVMDELVVGTSGDDAGARGALVALDASSGAQRWKVFSTGPDNEVGIGENFRPFYKTGDGSDLGTTTWSPSSWQQGGGGLAGPLTFDAGSGVLDQAREVRLPCARQRISVDPVDEAHKVHGGGYGDMLQVCLRIAEVTILP